MIAPSAHTGNLPPASLTPISRHELLEMLIRFILHKFKIFNSKPGSHYQASMAYQKAIARTNDLLRWAQGQAPTLNVTFVYRYILMNKEHLYAIMPHSNNRSYQSQLETLEKIIKICEDGLQITK